MIQTREPIPTCILLNPVSLLQTWHFKHGKYATKFPFTYIIKRIASRQSNENFFTHQENLLLSFTLTCRNNSTFHEIQVLSKDFRKCLHGRILGLSQLSSFNCEILVQAWFPFNQTFVAQETCQTNFVFQELEMLGS